MSLFFYIGLCGAGGVVLFAAGAVVAAFRAEARDQAANARRQPVLNIEPQEIGVCRPWGYNPDQDAPHVAASAEEIAERATSFTEHQAAYFGAPAGSVQASIQPNAQGHNTAIMDPATGRAYATFYASEW